MSTRELSIALHRSVHSVNNMAYRMHLTKAKLRDNDAIREGILKMYPYFKAEDIAALLHLSTRFVYKIAEESRTTKDAVNKMPVMDYGLYIKENLNKKSFREMAKGLNVNVATIRRHASKLGLRQDQRFVSDNIGLTLKRTLLFERLLRESGLKPEVDRALGYNRKDSLMLWRLRKRGYILCMDEKTVLYSVYTNRSLVTERHAISRGYVFVECPSPDLFEDENEGTGVPEKIKISNMEIKGKIIDVLPLREGTNSKGKQWQSQNYVLETEDEHPQRCLFEVFGDENIRKYDLQKGDRVTVKYDTAAKQYKDTWFGTNRAWNVIKED